MRTTSELERSLLIQHTKRYLYIESANIKLVKNIVILKKPDDLNIIHVVLFRSRGSAGGK